MNESKPIITVDPDGTTWVGVKVSPQMFRVLQDEENMRRLAVAASREFWRLWAEKMDRDLTGGL